MMRLSLFSAFSILFPAFFWAQTPYFQQDVQTQIAVTLDDKNNTLAGTITIDYTNNAPQTLDFIYFHLWANAFSDKKTAFAKQYLANGNASFHFAEPKDMGGYEGLDFRADGKKCEVEPDPQHLDIVKLKLGKPLKTGEKIQISTPFSLKIPFAFSRFGHVGQQYLMTQWFPKPAVFDAQGWHAMPYLDQGEFYSEFGNYDVSITLPENYVVAATGSLETPSEQVFLEKKILETAEKLKNTELANPLVMGVSDSVMTSSSTLKTVRFKAEKVHDFAWFADKKFLVQRDDAVLENGQKVPVYAFFTAKYAKKWQKSAFYVSRAVGFYSKKVGNYPHPQATAVMSDASFPGGMEYPMITVLSGNFSEKELDITITHEVGHNWFQGILGNNERAHAWLDEGLNSFYEKKYAQENYGDTAQLTNSLGFAKFFFKGSNLTIEDVALISRSRYRRDQASIVSSDSLSFTNYFIGAYEKPVIFLKNIEKIVGEKPLAAAMQAYYRDWQFKHPQPEDFLSYIRPLLSAEDFEKNWAILSNPQTERSYRQNASKSVRFGFLFSVDNTKKHNIYAGILPAYNRQDGFMAGVWLHNGFLPLKQTEWSLLPMYGFKSKKLAGLAEVNHFFYAKNHRITLGFEAKSFGKNSFSTVSDVESYLKLTPSVSIEFGQSARSKFTQTLSFRQLFIKEDDFTVSGDQVQARSSTWSRISELSYLGVKKSVLGDMTIHGALEYQPYTFNNLFQQYLKATLGLKKDFAYKEHSFINLRLFAGAFLLNSGRNAGSFYDFNARGSLSLTGRNLNDYRYDELWLGRGIETGFGSQQVTENINSGWGGMTFLLPAGETTKIGFSNNFVASLCLSADLPVRPLGILTPKPYFDMGYFSDSRPAGVRTGSEFLATGGLTWAFFDNKIKVNLPLYFSGGDELDGLNQLMSRRGNFWSRLSFQYNLTGLSPKRLLKGILLDN